MNPFKVGDLIDDRFRVERVLGKGGMGAVFAAVDRELGRRVAIKVMLEHSARDPVSAERFQREARSAVQLESAHAARIYDFGRATDGGRYIVMEYLEGEDLDAHVSSRGPLSIDAAVDCIVQACDAVAEAHRLGVVHRDLKLRNLFLTKTSDGRPLVKVLDFGIAKRTSAAADPALTEPSATLGSPAYMAPEQMVDANQADARSDLWSLAVCLYEFLTGHMPFESKSVHAVCAMVLKDAPKPLSAWRDDISAELERAITTCLEKDPSKRFASVPAWVEALRAATPVRERSMLPPTAPTPRPPNEDARLAALRRYHLLDTPPEDDFTFLAELAAALCDAPVAFVSLVDEDRVWYKACHGLDEALIQSFRDDSYCAWTVLEDTLLHMPDLTQDARAARLSYTVGEPHLRMYCGANIITPDGLKLGTICVVDTSARELSKKQQELLTKLARQVMALIELRAKKADLETALGEVKRVAAALL